MLKLISNKSVRKKREFVWVTANKRVLTPKSMSTNHLFSTIIMIWNHSAPDQFKITPYKKYVFHSIYTPTYMSQAVTHMYNELSTRDDLTASQKFKLDFITAMYQHVFGPKLIKGN